VVKILFFNLFNSFLFLSSFSLFLKKGGGNRSTRSKTTQNHASSWPVRYLVLNNLLLMSISWLAGYDWLDTAADRLIPAVTAN